VTPRPLSRIADFSGNDTFIYELGGAAMIGYGVALATGLRTARWEELRFVVLATYAFSALAFLAGFASFAGGLVSGTVLVISIWAVFVSWSTGQIVVAHRGIVAGPRDVATWVAGVLALATLSAAVFGLGPQLPGPFAALMGYQGTDEYVYRLAGAACFGYAVMGVQELRSLHWDDMWVPNVMAIVFNGLAFIASGFEIAAGRTTLLAVLVALAAGFFALAIGVILVRRGR
jgi:hypothetical protein